VIVLKRAFDLVTSSLGLVALSPILVAIAVTVKLSSSGPVFFRQERIGRNFVPFRIFKFRTMKVCDRPESLITIKGDPRVTPFGRFLRGTKLDELPQLINVLKGEMSLVGPRPEVPEYVGQFRADYEEILLVRPGMTDEASVLYRNEEEILAAADDPHDTYIRVVLPRKIQMAKEYLRKRSFGHDLTLIFRTLARL
jgi:lipopolysaccharide/colanic/teichoic acid biosynthesis glycosyltransferase